jgi:glycosyltransferase involved in cell wall biosynthesis
LASPLTFSILICTHNRSRYLADVVESLRAQEYERDAYEVVVVDNASTDDTLQVVEQLQSDGDLIVRYIYEPQLGVSHARNTGAQAIQSDVIAYVDDDSIVDVGWIKALADVFESDDHVVCVGGRIELWWDNPRPDWLPVELEGYLGRTPFIGDTAQEYPEGVFPFSGNMAIRRDALEAVEGFDSRFGRVGSRLRAHGETRMSDCLRAVGKVMFAPHALIYHRVLPGRGTRKYFLRRGLLQGVADINLELVRNPDLRRFDLLQAFVVNMFFLGKDILDVTWNWFSGRKKAAFAQSVYTFSRFGRLLETARLVLTGHTKVKED